MLGGWSGTPFYANDKTTNQDMYVIHNVMSERLEKSHTCAAVQEYVARWMNSHVLYCRERERI